MYSFSRLLRAPLRFRPSAELFPPPATFITDSSTCHESPSLRISWMSLQFCIGVVQSIAGGFVNGKSVTEVVISSTELTRSISASSLSQCEKLPLKVTCVGKMATTAEALRIGDIVHVAGRLQLLPRYVAVNATYEYEHEIVVLESGGSIHIVLSHRET